MKVQAPEGKWGQRGMRGRFVGYTQRFNTFRVYRANSRGKFDVFIHCDVYFLGSQKVRENEPNSGRNESAALVPIDVVGEEGGPLDNFETGSVSETDSSATEIYDPAEMGDGEAQASTSNESRPGESELATQAGPQKAGSSITVMKRSLTDSLKKKLLRPKVDADEGKGKITMNYSGSRFHPQLRIVRSELHTDQPDLIVSIRPDYKESSCVACDLDDLQEDEEHDETYNDLFGMLHANLAVACEESDSVTYEEALAGPNKEKWRAAMQDELRALAKNKVWTLVKRPEGKNIVSNKWVLRVKRNPDGSIGHYKARLVARGFTQMPGLDYGETYAPVASLPAIRILFACSVLAGWEVLGFDVTTAFLYGSLDEEVFMKQPFGFEEDDRVCKLQRSLYGLKQSPRMWNIRFSRCLSGLGLKQAKGDSCIFKGDGVVLCIYVDDALIFSKERSTGKALLEKIGKEFEMREVKLDKFPGFQLDIVPGKVKLHQNTYIRQLLKKYEMQDANPVATPMSLEYKPTEERDPLALKIPYRQLVGSLMYAAVTTRLGIAFAVGLLSQKLAEPTVKDWVAAKRVLRYLVSRENDGIEFSSEGNREVEVFCDADFGGSEGYNSTTGGVVKLAGGPVHWLSKKQKLISLSSTEA